MKFRDLFKCKCRDEERADEAFRKLEQVFAARKKVEKPEPAQAAEGVLIAFGEMNNVE